jgi:hypothetical protein
MKQQAILAAMQQTNANGSQPCSSQQSIASYLSSENARAGGNLEDKRNKKRSRKQDKTRKMPSKLKLPPGAHTGQSNSDQEGRSSDSHSGLSNEVGLPPLRVKVLCCANCRTETLENEVN